MNLANFLSCLRIALVPVFLILLSFDMNLLAFFVFIFAGFTDALDGYFARVYGMRTVVGSYLDPAADKILVLSTFIFLSIKEDIPAWPTILILIRDFVMVFGTLIIWLLKAWPEIKPTIIGKASVVFQLLIILSAIFRRDPFLSSLIQGLQDLSGITGFTMDDLIIQSIIGMAFCTVFSALQYIYRGYRFFIAK